MPIGLVSNEAFDQELASYTRAPKSVHSDVVPSIVELDRPGRSQGDVNVPESLRKIIGETAVIDGRQQALQIAEQFGISPASVSAYAKGATSTASYNSPNAGISSFIAKSRNRAIKRAGKTLNAALGAITQEKLDYTDADKLSGIAKDMSVIIKNLEPQSSPLDPTEGKTTPQFVIFAPTFRDERTFESIVVSE